MPLHEGTEELLLGGMFADLNVAFNGETQAGGF
jgi:hypothetical protein